MTMSSAVSKVTLNGDGSQTSWPFSFKVWKADDLEVILTSPEGTESVTTDWSVVLAGIGGTLTYPILGDTLPTGWKITIRRSMGFLQEVDLVSGTRWDPEVVETALDQAAAERQQLLEEIRRSVRIGVASTENPENVVAEIFYARQVAEDSASAAQEYAGIAVSAMDAAALSEAAAGLSEANAAGSEAAAAISAGAAYADATTAESARDTAVLKAAEAAASAATAEASLNAEAWSASVNYIVGDVVYTTTGKSYRCIDPNINNNPDTDDGSNWFLMTLALGETSNTAYRGDRGKTAYDHSRAAHAPSNAQKNSDITKGEIEAVLTGEITSHSHMVGALVWSTGSTPLPGTIAAQGVELSRAIYSRLWAYAQSSGNIAVSDAAWTYGQYSPGDGSTTFRVPKVDDRFIRGKSATRAVGLVEEDAIRNITGAVGGAVTGYFGNPTGAFSTYTPPPPEPYAGMGGASVSGIKFDSSRVVPTADENRPKALTMLPCIVY